jgi:hypothetical protein
MDGMDGMDSDGSGHEHHQSAGVNSTQNHAYARDYWYLAAGVAGSLLLLRGIGHLQARQRYVCLIPKL